MAQRVRRLSTGLLCLGGGSLTPAGCCGKSGLAGEGRHSAVAKQGSYCWIEHTAPLPVKQSIFIIIQSALLHNHPDIFTMLFTTYVRPNFLAMGQATSFGFNEPARLQVSGSAQGIKC